MCTVAPRRADHTVQGMDTTPPTPPEQAPEPTGDQTSAAPEALPADVERVVLRVQPTWRTVLGQVAWQRLLGWLVVVVVMLVVATAAPRALLDPPARDGREGLARWRGWATGQLAVTDQYAAELYEGFTVTTRGDGATVLGSAGEDGVCWKLVVTDGVPVGPARDASGDACRPPAA